MHSGFVTVDVILHTTIQFGTVHLQHVGNKMLATMLNRTTPGDLNAIILRTNISHAGGFQ